MQCDLKLSVQCAKNVAHSSPTFNVLTTELLGYSHRVQPLTQLGFLLAHYIIYATSFYHKISKKLSKTHRKSQKTCMSAICVHCLTQMSPFIWLRGLYVSLLKYLDLTRKTLDCLELNKLLLSELFACSLNLLYARRKTTDFSI